MITVLLQRLHVVTECVVSTIRIWQYVREETVAHTDTEKSLDISLFRNNPILAKTLQCWQEKHAASRLKNLTTFHHFHDERWTFDGNGKGGNWMGMDGNGWEWMVWVGMDGWHG